MEKELVYLYDGSFEGLLTCVYEIYYRKDDPKKIIPKECNRFSLIEEYIQIDTDTEKFKKVYESIERKISREFLRTVFYIYLSEEEDSGIIILDYIRTGYKFGRDVLNYQTNPHVRAANEVYRRVSYERHRYLGLLRFKMLEGGVLYATIEPDHNIISMLGGHFSQRMSSEYWIIHDVKRNIAVFYNKEQWIIRSLNESIDLRFDENEQSYQELWKTYYKHISIPNRKNLRQKRAYMPTRYWKHLVEEGVQNNGFNKTNLD